MCAPIETNITSSPSRITFLFQTSSIIDAQIFRRCWLGQLLLFPQNYATFSSDLNLTGSYQTVQHCVISSTMASTTSFYACFHSNCTRLQAPCVHKSLSSNLFGLLFFTTLPTPASTQRFWLWYVGIPHYMKLSATSHPHPPSSFLSACTIVHHFQADTDMMQFDPRACLRQFGDLLGTFVALISSHRSYRLNLPSIAFEPHRTLCQPTDRLQSCFQYIYACIGSSEVSISHTISSPSLILVVLQH
jgi:hypothetical protein